MKKLKLGIYLGIGLLLPIPTIAAETHFHNDPPSVDGKEIRWGTSIGTTFYTGERDHAISKWNALGTINIAGDTPFVIEDLSFDDYYKEDNNLARWFPFSGVDLITPNVYNFEAMTLNQRKKSMMHEFGHALGLNEHTETPGSIMLQGKISQTELSQHDKDDYYKKWGK